MCLCVRVCEREAEGDKLCDSVCVLEKDIMCVRDESVCDCNCEKYCAIVCLRVCVCEIECVREIGIWY